MRTIRLAWPLTADPAAGGDVFLNPDQARHGAVVLRLKPGDAVEMTGPQGLAPAEVVFVGCQPPHSRQKPGLAVRLTGPWQSPPSPGPRLALALIQGPRFDWAVEKAVELGAAQLIPLITRRTKPAHAQPGPGREARWARLAEEARKQCGRPGSLEILPPLSLDRLAALPGPSFFLSLAESAASQERPALSRQKSPLLAIGPEGGFTPEEEAKLLAAGFTPVSLGPYALRAETAALAALALCLGE